MRARLSLLIAAAALLAGCEAPPPVSGPSVSGPSGSQPDLCRAADYRVLIGQPRAVLGRMTLPAGTRIIGPDDAVTADYNPQRANIEVGASGRIEKVSCY